MTREEGLISNFFCRRICRRKIKARARARREFRSVSRGVDDESERETCVSRTFVSRQNKVSSRVIGMNPSIQTEARCYQVTISHHSRRMKSGYRETSTHLFDNILARHRETRFARFLVNDSFEHDRWIGDEHLHHQVLSLRGVEKS